MDDSFSLLSYSTSAEFSAFSSIMQISFVIALSFVRILLVSKSSNTTRGVFYRLEILMPMLSSFRAFRSE